MCCIKPAAVSAAASPFRDANVNLQPLLQQVVAELQIGAPYQDIKSEFS